MRSITLSLALLSVCATAAAAQTAPPPAPPSPPPATTSTGAAAGAPVAADPLGASVRPRSRGDRLTEAEIAQATVTSNAYDLVRRLRPAWLRNRGYASQPDNDGSAEPQVWYNGRHLGNLETLRDITIAQIVEMRYVDPIQARTTYGPGNGRGVISITGR